jgi:hypothetical protein
VAETSGQGSVGGPLAMEVRAPCHGSGGGNRRARHVSAGTAPTATQGRGTTANRQGLCKSTNPLPHIDGGGAGRERARAQKWRTLTAEPDARASGSHLQPPAESQHRGSHLHLRHPPHCWPACKGGQLGQPPKPWTKLATGNSSHGSSCKSATSPRLCPRSHRTRGLVWPRATRRPGSSFPQLICHGGLVRCPVGTATLPRGWTRSSLW